MSDRASDCKTCIYCKKAGGAFNREHVVPVAFGSYQPKAMVLHQMVCRECNTGFGRYIDLVLARDSYEGLLRPEVLGSTSGKKDRFRPRRFSIQFPDQERFGDLRGARVVIDWATREHRVPDQIIGRHPTGKIYTFTAEEYAVADEQLLRQFPPGTVRIIASTGAGRTALEQAVLARGRKVKERWSKELPPAACSPVIDVEVQGFTDVTTMRAIAKISFNYLAYIKGAAYVLQEKFNPIRNYVTGKKVDRAMVRVIDKPILSVDEYHWRAFDGHLVLFMRVDRSLRGKVSLFNSFTYEIMLCADLGLFYRDFSGHAFDPVGRRITPIINTRLSVVPVISRITT